MHEDRNDRPRPDGRQYRAPADARRATRSSSFDRDAEAVAGARRPTARSARTRSTTCAAKLDTPGDLLGDAARGRPDRAARSQTIADAAQPGDIIIDGGNTFYKDDIRRAKALRREGHPLCRCRHVGRRLGAGARLLHDDRRRRGDGRPARSDLRRRWRRASARSRARPAASTTRPIRAPRRAISMPARRAPGHFVKMVHNGIEYGLMQAYAEGFDILKGKIVGQAARGRALRPQPDRHRRGLAARQRDLVLAARPDRDRAGQGQQARQVLAATSPIRARASGRSRRRWRRAVPANVLTAALFARYRSRVEHTFGDKLLSAMRFGFGGHVEMPQ